MWKKLVLIIIAVCVGIALLPAPSTKNVNGKSFNTKAYKELYPNYKDWNVSQVHNMFVDSMYGTGKLYMNTTGVDGNGNNFVYIYEFDGDDNVTFHLAMNENEASKHYNAIVQVLANGSNGNGEMNEITTIHGQSSAYTYYHRYDQQSKEVYMGICNASLECTSFDQENSIKLASNIKGIIK